VVCKIRKLLCLALKVFALHFIFVGAGSLFFFTFSCKYGTSSEAGCSNGSEYFEEIYHLLPEFLDLRYRWRNNAYFLS